jgi:5-methylcytosine-specific restriction endonuclease McrA
MAVIPTSGWQQEISGATEDHMRLKSIASHLRSYRMLARRRTTINHMFAAAVAPHDLFDEARVREAVALLGNDPDSDLVCAYCGEQAETWDHVFATVKDSRFSGHGHRLGNLLPCCKPCNSQKGNKPWKTHLDALPLSEQERAHREALIDRYIGAFGRVDDEVAQTSDHERLDAIRGQILDLIAEGDEVAARIRAGVGND